jgi:acyl dehydratase
MNCRVPLNTSLIGRVVHGEQRFVYHRAVVAGDILTITVKIDDIRPAGANELVATTTRVADASGAPVAEIGAVFVSRGTGSSRAAEQKPSSDYSWPLKFTL